MHVKPSHVKITTEKIGDKVIAVGDPARIEVFTKFLKDCELVSTYRGFTAYTGYFNNEKITIICHGIGSPSAAIVFEELKMYNVKLIVRIGTCGSLKSELRRGMFVIPTAAGYFKYSPIRLLIDREIILPAIPDLQLTNSLYNKLKDVVPIKLGLVFSNDMFYIENPELANKLSKHGFDVIEMECATLFTIGLLRKISTSAILLIANSLVNPDEYEILSSSECNKYFEKITRPLLEVISSYTPCIF